MSTTARRKEADAASAAFQVALTQIGVETIEEALALWSQVPPTRVAATSASWLDKAVNLILLRRQQSRDLALAYYRLARALHTGRTIPLPGTPEPEYVTLQKLRSEFAQLAQTGQEPAEPAREGSSPASQGDDTPQPPSEPQSGAERVSDAPSQEEDDADAEADRILVEEIEGLTAEGDAEEARLEREAEEEARIVLEALGPNNYAKKTDDIDTDELTGSEVDALRDEAHAKAGSRQAAAAERVVMDGGRGALWSISERDRRAIGFVRMSRTGTPCGWCAMLISRGFVPIKGRRTLYSSRRSANFAADGDKYHDNCHCYAMPIFSTEHWETSELFKLNRQYGEAWPRVTKGLSGKAAVSAWRRYIRTEHRSSRPGGGAT